VQEARWIAATYTVGSQQTSAPWQRTGGYGRQDLTVGNSSFRIYAQGYADTAATRNLFSATYGHTRNGAFYGSASRTRGSGTVISMQQQPRVDWNAWSAGFGGIEISTSGGASSLSWNSSQQACYNARLSQRYGGRTFESWRIDYARPCDIKVTGTISSLNSVEVRNQVWASFNVLGTTRTTSAASVATRNL